MIRLRQIYVNVKCYLFQCCVIIMYRMQRDAHILCALFRFRSRVMWRMSLTAQTRAYRQPYLIILLFVLPPTMPSNWLYTLRRTDLLEMRHELRNVVNSAADAETWAQTFSKKLVRPAHHADFVNCTDVATAGRCDRGFRR
jgi:hypothetical protein